MKLTKQTVTYQLGTHHTTALLSTVTNMFLSELLFSFIYCVRGDAFG